MLHRPFLSSETVAGSGGLDTTSPSDAPAAAGSPVEQPSPSPALADGRLAAFWLLLVARFVATMLTLPFSYELLSQAGAGQVGGGEPLPRPAMIAVMVVGVIFSTLIFSAPAAGLGLLVAPRVGLGAPVLQAWLSRRPVPAARLRRAAVASAVLGFTAGVAAIGLSLLGTAVVPDLAGPTIDHPSAWSSFLAAVGAGVSEEVWMRLGAMSLVALVLTMLSARSRPTAWMMWTANGVAALLFGAMHLPQASMLLAGGELGAVRVAFVLGANGLGGLGFGWLFWRHGLLAAMGGHFAADLVLHVVVPVVMSG